MIITGIGSRETPEETLELFEQLGADARARDWWIRSGHAEGADYAFEKGAKDHCIVYLPWNGFNKDLPLLGRGRTSELRDDALDFVYRHDKWADPEGTSQGVKRIKQRNVFQVLGEDLKSPSDLVICWTEEGKVVGGTGLAIRIAREHNIPIINLGNQEVEENFQEILQDHIMEIGA